MSDMLKKQAVGFYFSVAAILLAVASMISYGVLSQDGEKTPTSVYLLACAAIVIQIVVIIFNNTGTGKKFYNTSSFLAAVLYSFCLVQLFTGRLEWLGGLAAHNANFAPLHLSFFVTIILFAVTMCAGIVACFCKQLRDEE